jgi:hypothetical protein
MSIRAVPDNRPRHRHDPPEPPAPRMQVSYRCSRNHRFEVTFAAGAELPQAVDCRCGASAHRPESSNVVMTESASVVTADSEHERRMEQLLGRRTKADLEQILAEALAAMRKAAAPSLTKEDH